jgi:LmbE family N-acetylglucosaminyl deacetylase
MKVLCIGAHPDDEVLGCGGTIDKFIDLGHEIDYYIVSRGRGDKRDQRFDSYPLRDFIEAIEHRIARFSPDLIFSHHLNDMNKDHRIISEATIIASRGMPIDILGYEVFSSSGNFSFNPDTYVSLSSRNVEKKITLMEMKYKNEMRKYPHPRSIEGIMTLAKYRGMQANLEFAEAFITLKNIIV